jgi:hypothetical protein
VKVDFDKGAHFAAIKTFAIQIGTTWSNPSSEKRIVTDIEEALAATDWARAEADKAEARVVRHGATGRQDLDTFYSRMGG